MTEKQKAVNVDWLPLQARLRGCWWWNVSRKMTAEAWRWRVAYWVPRKVALFVFIRVYACTGEAPGDEYRAIYDAWEHGAGR